MTISAKIVADSVSLVAGHRLTTLQLRYPKFIHGEFMTHRVFSRNASSSRAIPVERLIKDVLSDPAMPIHWGRNQPGMQADEEGREQVYIPYFATSRGSLSPTTMSRERAWLEAMDDAVRMARAFAEAGYHKQIVNRLLEPFCHINVVVTATEWSNFFALRRHADAQPEMRILADAIWAAMAESTPAPLRPGEWHLPYARPGAPLGLGDDLIDCEEVPDEIAASVARCARVSYMTHEGKTPTREQDLALYQQLVGAQPIHASPAEHQATPDRLGPDSPQWMQPNLHGNFCGWIQFRKLLPGESQ